MPGSRVSQTSSMASCCVLAMVEANRPIPRPESRKMPEMTMKERQAALDRHVEPEMAHYETSTVSISARMTYGRTLPTTSSHGRMGVTMSCSIVPRSRSRTTAVAVRIAVKA